jgi:hypothetical protein
VDERARALGRLYDEVTAEVKVLVDRADPEGLLGMRAPADEYDDTVVELTRRVLKDESLDPASIERWFGSVYGAAPAGADALVQELEKLRQRAENDGPLGIRGKGLTARRIDRSVRPRTAREACRDGRRARRRPSRRLGAACGLLVRTFDVSIQRLVPRGRAVVSPPFLPRVGFSVSSTTAKARLGDGGAMSQSSVR